MSALESVRSRDNARYKRLRALASDARKRLQLGETVLDGVHLIAAALDQGHPLRSLWVRDDARANPEIAALLGRAGVNPTLLPAALFDAASPVSTPGGILAVIALPPASAPVAPGNDQRVVALDGVQDAGNLGTLLRTAAAAGVRHIWLGEGCARAWSPRALRAGMGAQFVLTLAESLDLAAVLGDLRDGRLPGADACASLDVGPPCEVLVAQLDPGAVDLHSLALPARAVWVFGAEGQGVSAAVAACATRSVQIPMADGVESINVSAAAAVCLFEHLRQRRLADAQALAATG